MFYSEKPQQIEELRSAIQSHSPLSVEVLKKVNYKFRLEWNYTSNSMEGNSLTRSETRSVMIGNITVHGKPIRDVMEMKGHDDVITSIIKMGAGELQLSEKRMREIHKAIMHEDDPKKDTLIGRWKTQDNYLINYKGERIDFTPHAETPEAMHKLANWLSAEREKIATNASDAMHPAFLAFKFHLDYVSIHPFYDGNGRTARIFTNLILIAYGYPPIWVKENERDAYYQYLADIQGYGGSPDVLYDFMADLLLRSQRLVLDAIEGREIEEAGDLDKKLALLKKRLGISHSDNAGLTYSGEVVRDIINFSITPFAEAWDRRLKSFDALFETRNVLVTTKGAAQSERNPATGLQALYAKALSAMLQKDEKIEFIKFQCAFGNLLTIRKVMGVNGGEITFTFYENRYDVIQVGAKYYPINKLYGEQLTEDEIAMLVEGVSNWAYDNIETILENEERERES